MIILLIVMAALLWSDQLPFVASVGQTSINTFAAIQFAPLQGDESLNKKRLVDLIIEAKRRGARYIVLPELSLNGALDHPGHQYRLRGETIPGPSTNFFGEYARKLSVWLVLSVIEEESVHGGYYITAVMIDDHGEVIYKCRKNLVRLNHGDGSAIRGNYRDIIETVDDHGLRIGIISGDDIQAGVPRLADRGASTILVTAAWSKADITNWDDLCRRLAQQYSVNLVVANRRSLEEGEDDDSYSLGGIYLRQGTTFAPERKDGGEVITATLRTAKNPLGVTNTPGLPASVPGPIYQTAVPEIIELGRKLFFDKNLSSTGTVSCSSCHQPEHAFANGEEKGAGVYGRKTKRNVPSLLNVAFRPLLQWDGYASTLENFAKYPISGYTEMNFHYLDKVESYIRSQPAYVAAFRSAMGVEEIHFDAVARALSAYERTLISGNSAFDRYYYGGDKTALGESARRGLDLFTGKAGCSSCHLINDRYALFMDLKYHSLGVGYDQEKKEFDDIGLGGISSDDFSGLFQTPSLRNVAQTPPYMHDGSLKTLEEVVEFYNRGGTSNDHLDPLIKPLSLSEQEKKDLVAFLLSLDGDQKYSTKGVRLRASPH